MTKPFNFTPIHVRVVDLTPEPSARPPSWGTELRRFLSFANDTSDLGPDTAEPLVDLGPDSAPTEGDGEISDTDDASSEGRPSPSAQPEDLSRFTDFEISPLPSTIPMPAERPSRVDITDAVEDPDPTRYSDRPPRLDRREMRTRRRRRDI